MNRMKSVWVLALMVICSLLAYLQYGLQPSAADYRFDTAEWKSPTIVDGGDRTTRSYMCDDLLATHDFEGFTKQELFALLGSAESGGDFGFEQWDLVYWLGLERAGDFSLDDEVLGFDFDEAGRVIRYGTSTN